MSFTGTVYRGAWNTGADLNIVIIDNTSGSSLSFGGRMQGHKATSKDTVLESPGMDNGGRVDHMVIPGGVSGTIMITRYSGDLINIQKFLTANYYAGEDQRYYTITRTIRNRYGGGSQDEDVFTDAVITIDDGDWAKAKEVPMTLTFHASQLQ